MPVRTFPPTTTTDPGKYDMFPEELAILHIEDNANDAVLIERQLQQHGISCKVCRVETRQEFVNALSSDPFDVILSDYSLPGFDGAAALKLALDISPQTPFIFLSGTIGEERAVSILKQGAADYVLKDNMVRLPSVIERALREAESRKERHKAEFQLQETRHFIERVTEAVPDVLYVFSLTDRTCVYVSGKIKAVLGYTASEMLENRSIVTDLVQPEDLPTVEEYLSSFGQCKDEEVRELDVRLLHGRKEWRWYRIRGTVFTRDASGGPTQILGTIQDVSRHKAAAEKLQQQAALLEIARDAILVLDLDLNIRFWNQAAENLYGWGRHEILGRPHHHLSGGAGQEVAGIHGHVMEHGEWFGEMKHKTRDGRDVVVQSRWSLAKAPQADTASILVINTDITEKKDLERQFLRAQRLESIGALAGGIAHDLNNILAPILMGAEMLLSRHAPEKGEEDGDTKILETILNSGRRGAELVRQVLTFAKGVRKPVSSIQIHKIVRELEGMARGTFPSSIEVTQSCADDLWSVRGDITQIHQILLNLCVNARDAMPKGGELHLIAENFVADDQFAQTVPDAQPGSYVALSVKDTGTGIDDENLGAIFDPFFTTKDAGHGTGLGLATVQSIVKTHGGFLTVETTPGKGTTFTVYLPADRAIRQETESPPKKAPARGQGQLILVIDDESTITDITRETLSSFGYCVATASDGAEGLAVFARQSEEIAAVIVDMHMPVLDGPATVAALRRLNPEVRIIATGGLLTDQTADPLSDLKVAHILRKPFTTNELLDTVQAVLE